VKLAQTAVAATNRKDPTILDTLAAAYAETGQFTNAVSAQKAALVLLQDETTKRVYTNRLRLYESTTPYREGD
jgi:serine/threonine-protein kinase